MGSLSNGENLKDENGVVWKAKKKRKKYHGIEVRSNFLTIFHNSV